MRFPHRTAQAGDASAPPGPGSGYLLPHSAWSGLPPGGQHILPPAQHSPGTTTDPARDPHGCYHLGAILAVTPWTSQACMGRHRQLAMVWRYGPSALWIRAVPVRRDLPNSCAAPQIARGEELTCRAGARQSSWWRPLQRSTLMKMTLMGPEDRGLSFQARHLREMLHAPSSRRSPTSRINAPVPAVPRHRPARTTWYKGYHQARGYTRSISHTVGCSQAMAGPAGASTDCNWRTDLCRLGDILRPWAQVAPIKRLRQNKSVPLRHLAAEDCWHSAEGRCQ